MSDWLAWQIVDSAFPTGAFAHSGGLEAAWQQGEVAGTDALQRFVQASVLQAGYGTLPLVNAAYTDPERLAALDELAEAFLRNPVANRASRIQGRTLVATANRIWPSPALGALQARAAAIAAHLGPVWGATFSIIGLPLATTRCIVLYSAARSVLSAAVRLGIAGPYEAQQLQHACAPWLERVLERCGDLDERDLTQTEPVLDLLQAAHDRLYSRLFQS